jgi:hypothetical protein
MCSRVLPPPPRPQALKAEAARQRCSASASVFGYDDALRALHPFLRRWRAARAAHPDLRAYIVSADISKAFDTGAGPSSVAARALAPRGEERAHRAKRAMWRNAAWLVLGRPPPIARHRPRKEQIPLLDAETLGPVAIH